MARKVITVAMLIVILLSACPVFAAKFNIGDTVEVFNTGTSGLVVRDVPAGNYIGGKYDGDRGVVLAGPQTAALGGVVYTWWKVRWQDALEGWSAENWLMKVAPPDLTVEDIWIEPDPPSPGGLTHWGFRIRNQGAGDATGTFFLECYFDNTYGGRVTVYGLSAGSTYTTYWQYMTWPSNTNPHVIKGVVDPGNSISESNEGNNIRSESFQATAPPNQPPTIYNGYVTPSSGDTATTFSYYVTYSDPEGDPPTTTHVYIDGSARTMGYVSGSYVSGAVFRYSTLLSAGSHSYSFYFADSMHGHSRYLPPTGSYSGPSVQSPPDYRTLTVYSSPSGVSFTTNGVSHSTPWSGTYPKDTPVTLEMFSEHYTTGSRYYWYQWSDGVASMSRTIVMSSDAAVTGTYVGPYYELTITSSAGSPTGIPFTLNGVAKTTTYSEWLYQGYYSVEMPAEYNGYSWQHWLEDGDENRIRTISLTSTSVHLTAVYSAPYGPSLSIPIYAPSSQSAHQGTTLAFIFRVTNVGGATDTIDLSFSSTIGWNIQLSEYSVVNLEPSESRDVYLYLTVGGDGLNTVTIEGASRADPSKTSLCEIRANGYSGSGLLNVELEFSNTGLLSSRLLFTVPFYVDINASEIYLPSSSEAGICVAFDPTSWINSEQGFNSFSISVEERPYGETAVIPVKFDNYVITATNFDLTRDSYSFKNGRYEYDTCYGMASTAINHIGFDPATYDKTEDEAKFDIKWHQGDPSNWILGMRLLFGTAPNETDEYAKLKDSINLNRPMILALHPLGLVLHAVVAYKIVESGNKAFILCYDNNEPFSGLSDRQSFTYAIYDKTTQKLLFCVRASQVFEECEFLVHKPTHDPIANFYPLKEGYTWAQQVMSAYMDIINQRTSAIIQCPVNVTITDQYGRIVADNGTNQIPNATVASTNDMKYFGLPLELNYSVLISAYGPGDFYLIVTQPTANSSVSMDIYENISVGFGTQATLEITPHQMNQTMGIDNDGDGVIDELRSPNVREILYTPLQTYTLTVNSSPTGVVFTINGALHTVPWSGTFDEGASACMIMPEFHDGCSWSHWLEDGDTNRTKIVLVEANTTMTAIYIPTQPPLSVFISPLSASLLVGHSITFTSTTLGGVAPYTYQWFLDSAPVSGTTSASWTFTPSATGIFYVHLKVTDATNSTSQSGTARITVTTTTVGGRSTAITHSTKAEPVLPYIAVAATIGVTFAALKPGTRRRKILKSRS